MKWVTRERPKIDRLACPWLIHRFIDPEADVRYVAAANVPSVAATEDAIPCDMPGVEPTHVAPHCSFDAFLQKYALTDPALRHLADIVRAADTDTIAESPQAAGLLATSLGLGANFHDDQVLLDHAMVIYDALYTWCQTLADERHGWHPDRIQKEMHS